MNTRRLGKSDLEVSALSFGCGPVPGLLTAGPEGNRQATITRAIELGINWFDTAATYGAGQSEDNLGRILGQVSGGRDVHVATKVRLPAEYPDDVGEYIRRSVEQSLGRLRRPFVSLLQLHNSLTPGRGDLATSVTPDDVLCPGGILEALLELRQAGVVRHLGLTALGDTASIRRVLDSGEFVSAQVPHHLLMSGELAAKHFQMPVENPLIEVCRERNVGALAIRVLAGGALTGQPPSAHTLTTKFFPLDLYRADESRARQLAPSLPAGESLPHAAIQYAARTPGVTSALIGFSTPEQVEAAVAAL